VRPAAIVHASSSVGTHAGLLVGRALVGDEVPILGVEVGAIYDDPDRKANALAREAAALIGLDLAEPGADIRTGFLGPGYALPDAGTAAAIVMFARTEAIICDPVYSGKGAAGLLGLADGLPGPVVFWHTGGYHALFDPELAAALARFR
jgi:1-aminocyclopropane-1-carboxylate deaminase/D-cysteine desulfhydrase